MRGTSCPPGGNLTDPALLDAFLEARASHARSLLIMTAGYVNRDGAAMRVLPRLGPQTLAALPCR